MLGTSTWSEEHQPSHNKTTNYDDGYGRDEYYSGREVFWNAEKITGLSVSTSQVESFRLCIIQIQAASIKSRTYFECDGGKVVSYNSELTASSHLVSIVLCALSIFHHACMPGMQNPSSESVFTING